MDNLLITLRMTISYYLPYFVALSALISYFIGSLPFGLWVGLAKGVDIRTLGSKNIGATNVLRVLGPGAGALVFALDTLKGAAMVIVLRIFWPGPAGMPDMVFVGLCAVLGHTFSPLLRFKGGKGIATSLGVLLALSWQVALFGLGVWIVVVALTRYVSLASLLTALSLPFASYFRLKGEDRVWMLGLTITLLVLVTVKHRANIGRLLAGTESKFGQRVTETAPPVEETPHE